MPSSSQPKPRIRGGNLNVPKPDDLPECPDHGLPMAHNAETGLWHCPNFQCKRKARQRLTIGDLNAAVITGGLQMYVAEDGRHFLYIEQTRTLLDISSVLNPDSTGLLHNSSAYHVGLKFEEVHQPKN